MVLHFRYRVRLSDVGMLGFLLVFPLGGMGVIFDAYEVPLLKYFNVIKGGVFLFGAFVFPYVFYLFVRDVRVRWIDWLLLVGFPLYVILIMLIITLINYDVAGEVASGSRVGTYSYMFPVLFKSVSLMFLGYLIPYALLVKPGATVFFHCVLVLVISVFIDFYGFAMKFYGLVDSTNRAFTLYLSDVFAISSLAFIVVCEKRYRLMAAVLSLIILLYIGSRTAFFGVFISLLVIMIVYGYRYLFWPVLFSAVSIIWFAAFFDISNIENPFLLRFLVLDASDSSIAGRINIVELGFLDMRDHFYTGNFGGQLSVSGDEHGARWGGYLHSILSYWRQFGFFSFLFLILSCFYGLFRVATFSEAARGKSLVILVSVYVLTVSVFSRGFVYGWIFLVPGMCFGYILSLKIRQFSLGDGVEN